MYWPDGDRPPQRSAIYCAFCVVVLGGFVAGCAFNALWIWLSLASMFGLVAFHQCNGRDTVQHLAEQLKQRPSFSAEAWGSEDRAAFAEVVGRIIADELGWPNSHFLPENPLELVLYCTGGDGADGMVIFDNFEKEFGRECEFPDVKTFGEFVDRNRARISQKG